MQHRCLVFQSGVQFPENAAFCPSDLWTAWYLEKLSEDQKLVTFSFRKPCNLPPLHSDQVICGRTNSSLFSLLLRIRCFKVCRPLFEQVWQDFWIVFENLFVYVILVDFDISRPFWTFVESFWIGLDAKQAHFAQLGFWARVWVVKFRKSVFEAFRNLKSWTNPKQSLTEELARIKRKQMKK